jgi:hypothetical protein
MACLAYKVGKFWDQLLEGALLHTFRNEISMRSNIGLVFFATSGLAKWAFSAVLSPFCALVAAMSSIAQTPVHKDETHLQTIPETKVRNSSLPRRLCCLRRFVGCTVQFFVAIPLTCKYSCQD